MKLVFAFIVVITILKSNGLKFEPKIIGGRFAGSHQFPYAAFIIVVTPNSNGVGCCGGSVLNQDFVLTAAHCFDNCIGTKCNLVSKLGNSDVTQGVKAVASKYLVHEDYDFFTVENDIALVRLKTTLNLGRSIKRVAVIKRTLYFEVGYIAGWGKPEENSLSSSTHLKYLTQIAIPRDKCSKFLKDMPHGSFCGKTQLNSEGYIAVGDSGSGLVIRNSIVIGLVSYKEDEFKQYIVFTDIAYYYNWIARHMRMM